jgi:two-component system nitrate/nitrite sensor histidine kinase NarX
LSTVSNRQHAGRRAGSPGSPQHSGHTAQKTWRRPAGWLFPKGLQRRPRALVASGLFGPLVALMSVLILLGISSFFVLFQAEPRGFLYIAQISLLFAGVVLIGVILMRIQRRLMEPLAHLRNWALRMRGGNLSARIPVPERGEFAELARDINSLGEELKRLSREMDQEVRKQTERIEMKNRSLEILYDVAASINTSRDLNDLLKRFLITLSAVTNAKAATVRLLTDDDQMRLVASLGMDHDVADNEEYVAVGRCMCGQAVREGTLLSQDNVRQCSRFAGRPFFVDEDVEMIAVPLQYRGSNLGVYNLFVPKPGLVGREDIKDLLTSIGRHLGMAIEKSRLDETSKRLSILRERNMLSHELHDSLAQTLASLRFQVRMLDETLQDSGSEDARKEVLQLKNGLDEAYTELRELLAHFRAPFDERGLVAAIEHVVDRFRKEAKIPIFFQNQWKDIDLPSVLEMQVLRIIQEALTNIRKYSNAHAVRVLLRNDADGNCVALVEDDGVGIQSPVLDGKPGEHIGLSIMQERAHRLGGELSIETEPGEGTRIVLTFHPGATKQRALL